MEILQKGILPPLQVLSAKEMGKKEHPLRDALHI